MPSKLSRYTDGVMEAAWLAAVVLVPLFFNIYSSRIFEPDKITILRSLALLALGAWVVKIIEQGRPNWDKVDPGARGVRAILRVPLAVPVLFLAGVYLLSTALSVVPRISFFGSYQRLQGTYTTLSYLVLFAALAVNLRRRAQVERLITTAILVSLPVSMYGVLQHYQIDPVPWAGNVSNRIASNMGNSIFVAAYLIMVNPLTLGRIVESFRAILKPDTRGLVPNFLRATIYVFIAALQLIALYFSRSRGPFLGWMAGSFFLFVLLSLHWRKRWMTVGIITLAAAAGLFLVALNVPGGPLENLRSSPWIGRLGQVFDMEQRTSRVRVLIWGGAAKLVTPHEPLDFPDGSQDSLNFLRPLIGYGPESMHVAYNKFFPPELARLEKRNASPDRSHNETWDALVTTGAVGLVAYLLLFGLVFYYALRWLGLIKGRRQQILFFVATLGGGAASAVGFVLWQGIEFFGVGLPFGLIVGLTAYLAGEALFTPPAAQGSEGESARALTIMVLLAAIVAHFVEINFGIAIAATRTYFWVYCGLLLVVGYVLPRYGQYGPLSASLEAHTATKTPPARNRKRKEGRRRRRGGRMGGRPGNGWLREGLIGAGVSALILVTLGYEFINVRSVPITSPATIWASFTHLPNRGGATSYGVLAMLVVIWLAGGLLFFAEYFKESPAINWQLLLVTLGVPLAIAFLYWLMHAGGLIRIALTSGGNQGNVVDQVLAQSAQFEGLLTRYYGYVLLLILALGVLLPDEWPVRLFGPSGAGSLVAPAILVVVTLLAYFTNVRIIQADMAFKLADPLSRQRQYEAAVTLYERANRFAFAEDYYYLFLGKANLEWAQTMRNPARQEEQVKRAERSLEEAQQINPLNTDHTANLARLYRWWASIAGEKSLRQARAQTSSEYYAHALTLSPYNAALWGEWGSLYLTVLRDREKAFETLTHALEVDPFYEATHAMLGDYYTRESRQAEDEAARKEALEKAAEQYQSAIDYIKPNAPQARQLAYNYRVALAGTYQQLGDVAQAIEVYEQAVQEAPANAEIWRVQEVIATLYLSLGDQANAMAYANTALATAPDTEKARIQAFINQIQGAP